MIETSPVTEKPTTEIQEKKSRRSIPKGLHLLALSIISSTLSFIWVILSEEIKNDLLRENWQKWFGIPWYESEPHIMVSVAYTILPTFALLILGLYLAAKFSLLNAEAKHRANLSALENAKDALQQGLASLETIEKEYKHRFTAFEKLQKEISDLESVRGEDLEDLRKKLNAVAHANRNSVWRDRLAGFCLGVLGSLLATFIWEALSKIPR